VDVPGHERFLGNMLAGVGAVDAVLLVVSAVEGWKAQSEEHLSILEVLGTAHGLVVLTHADRVDLRRRTEVEAQVRARLAVGPLAEAEVVATAVPAGAGLEELAAALDRLVRRTPAAADRGRPRLWVDRSFTIRGAGTVVTGTLTGGVLSVGQTLVTAPGDRPSRVRTIQVHDQPRDAAGPGHRVALNLPELTPADGGRGVALVEPDRWHPSTTIDATLTVLASAPSPVSRRGAPPPPHRDRLLGRPCPGPAPAIGGPRDGRARAHPPPRAVAAALVQAGLVSDVVTDAEYVLLCGVDGALDGHPWLERLASQPFRPPPPDGVSTAELDAMVRRRLVFVRDGICFPAAAIAEAMARLEPVATANPEGFTVSQARVALQTTRKFALPQPRPASAASPTPPGLW